MNEGINRGVSRQRAYALISMSNNDTYYVSTKVGREVQEAIADPNPNPSAFVRVYDIKNKTTVVLNLRLVSSIVVKGERDGEI